MAVGGGSGFSREGGLAAMVMAAGREVGDEGTPHPFSVCTTICKEHSPHLQQPVMAGFSMDEGYKNVHSVGAGDGYALILRPRNRLYLSRVVGQLDGSVALHGSLVGRSLIRMQGAL